MQEHHLGNPLDNLEKLLEQANQTPKSQEALDDSQERRNKHYEDRVVVFLDILGFKDFIRKSEAAENLDNLIFALEQPKNPSANKFISTWKIKKTPDDYDDKLTTFSDFFAFSVPLKVDENGRLTVEGAENLALLIYTSFFRARELLTHGFLCRGGISAGLLYHDDNNENQILFGPAFNRAYQLESELASIPRIILDSKVKNLIYDYNKSPDNASCKFYKLFDAHIKQAIDGPAYIDIFADFYTKTESAYPTYLDIDKDIIAIRDHLCKKLQNSTDNPQVFHKISSISRLFNKALKDSGRGHNQSLLVPSEYLPE